MGNISRTSKRWIFKVHKDYGRPCLILKSTLVFRKTPRMTRVGAAVRQSAGICGARCGPTGVAHHQNIEVGSPGADGMVTNCRRSERCHEKRCSSKRMGSSSKNFSIHPSLRITIPSYSKIIYHYHPIS